MPFEPKLDARELKVLSRAVQRMPEKATAEVASSLWRSVNTFSGSFGRRRLSHHGHGSLGRRSGQMARSRQIGVTGRGSIKGMRAFFLIDSPYALSHEAPPLGSAGKPIQPKRAKFLAIPVGGARTGAGVSKYASPLQDAPLSFIPSRREPGRKWYAVRKVEGRASDLSEMRWVLVKQVTLPARLNLVVDWVRALPRIRQDLIRSVANLLRRVVR